jgi:UDP-N-acetylglucosamine 4,6-dehydratase
MISNEDSYYTYEYSDYFKILPQINNWNKDKVRIRNGKKVSDGFTYSSNNNLEWMSKKNLKNLF